MAISSDEGVSRRTAIAARAPSTTDTTRPTLRSSCTSFVGRITKRAAASGIHVAWSSETT
jgi:hypothetical protein